MKSFLSLVAGIGIGIGIAISWSFNKNKYENMVQEEVETLREMKNKIKEEVVEEPTEEKEEIDNSVEEVYEETLNEAKHIINHNRYSKKDESEMGPCEKAAYKCPIHIITPDEFASEIGYDTDSFYIFEDDIITNDNNDIVDNVVEIFNLTTQEIRNQFGIYEQDVVYIRNEKIQMDYEILRELDTYEKRNGE